MKQEVTFESHDGQTFCLMLQKQQDSGVDAILCNIYAAQDYPFFIGDETESHYNVIDEDGEAVLSFDDALLLAKISVFILADQPSILPTEVMFDVESSPVQLTMIEYNALSSLILNRVPQVVADFYNGIESENAAEFVRMNLETEVTQ